MARARTESAAAAAARFHAAVPIADRTGMLGRSAASGAMHWSEVDPVAARSRTRAQADDARRAGTWLRLAALAMALRAAVPPAVVVLAWEVGRGEAAAPFAAASLEVAAVCGCLAAACLALALLSITRPVLAAVAAGGLILTAIGLLAGGGFAAAAVDQAAFGIALVAVAAVAFNGLIRLGR